MLKRMCSVRIILMILGAVFCIHVAAAGDTPFFDNAKVTLENKKTKKRLVLCVNPLKFRHLSVGLDLIPTLQNLTLQENVPSSRFLLMMHRWGMNYSKIISDAKRSYIASLFHQYHKENHQPVNLFDTFGAMMLHKYYYSKQWHKYRGHYRKDVERILKRDYTTGNRQPTLILRELAIDVIDEHQKNKTLTKNILKKQLKILYDVAQKGDGIAALYFAKFSFQKSLQSHIQLSQQEKSQYIELMKYVFSLPVVSSHQKGLASLALSSYDINAIQDVASAQHSQKYAKGRYEGFVAFMKSVAFPSQL